MCLRLGAILLNTNFILSGVGLLAFDGRIIGLQVLLILAWRVASVIGFEGLLFRGCGAVRRALHRDSADSNGTVQVARSALTASTSNPSAEAYLREPPCANHGHP